MISSLCSFSQCHDAYFFVVILGQCILLHDSRLVVWSLHFFIDVFRWDQARDMADLQFTAKAKWPLDWNKRLAFKIARLLCIFLFHPPDTGLHESISLFFWIWMLCELIQPQSVSSELLQGLIQRLFVGPANEFEYSHSINFGNEIAAAQNEKKLYRKRMDSCLESDCGWNNGRGSSQMDPPIHYLFSSPRLLQRLWRKIWCPEWQDG